MEKTAIQSTINDFRLDLTNIVKNEKQNKKKAKKFLKLIESDIHKMRNTKHVCSYNKILDDESYVYEDNILKHSKHAMFSTSLAYFNYATRYYALYYLYADNGKELNNRAAIIEGLTHVYDLTVYTTLNHFNYTCNKPLIWQFNTFFSQLDFTDDHIIYHINECLENINSLVSAIDKCDNLKVYEAYTKISNSQIINISTEPFPEFL